MKRVAFYLLLLVVLFGSLAVNSEPAWAQVGTPENEIRWFYIPLAVTPGRDWTDPEGMYHIRNQEEFGGLKGEIWGSAAVVYHADLDPVTGDGLAYGTITISSRGQVVWEGNWTQVLENHRVVAGTLAADGRDVNAGLSLIATHCVQQESKYYDRALSYLAYYGYIQPERAVRIH